MSGARNEDEDIGWDKHVGWAKRSAGPPDPAATPFEAALRSLQPRTDRLDARWRWLLGQEASLLNSPLSLRERAGASERPLSLWERAGVRAFGPDKPPPCTSPAGHEFLCLRCGSAAPTPSAVRRWAWPTALAGMTGVAAVLLVMLVVAHGRPAASPAVAGQPASRPSSQPTEMPDYQLATDDCTRWPLASGGDASYLKLRNQVLRYGVESWRQPASALVTTARATDAPLGHREQLRVLLEQQGLNGS
jgi:hypothetical protein